MTVPPPTLISILRDSLCGGSDLVITTPPSALPNVQYVWQTPTGVVPTTTPTLTIRNVNSSHSGLYTLKFAVNTCQSAATPSLRVTVLDLPTQGVFGGDDKVVCGGTTAQLSAQTIASQHITGNWIALDGAIITQPNVSNTTVSGLKTGNNRLVWSLTSSICGKIGTPDTVNLFVEKTPAALEKQFVLEGTVGSILINVKGLIQDSSNAKFTLTASISNVSMTPDNRFILFKRGDLKDAQTIEIPYQICSERCASLCASSKLFINVNKLIVPTDKIVVDTLFITNSSSKPSLEIQNIDKYEENEVLIFDRWGVRVFGPINYINGEFPKHAWDGKKDGQSLPNGAYYYIIKFKGKEQKQPERGVIYVVEGL
jgi:gliding motility-associated-like protein